MDYEASAITKPGKGDQKRRQSAKVRRRINAKAAYRASRPETCEVCHRGNRTLHVHHIIKLSQGGTDTPENFQLSCEPCHGTDHNLRVFTDTPLKWSAKDG